MPGNLQINPSETLIFLIEKSQESDYINTLQYVNKGQINNTDRSNLLSWVIDLSTELNLSIVTCLLACTYIDKFLSIRPNTGKKIFDLIGMVGLALAAKYKEGMLICPEIIKEMLRNKYTVDAIATTEMYFLNALGWKLGGITVCDVIETVLEMSFGDGLNEKMVSMCFTFAAMCYCELDIALHGNYNLAFCCIVMVLDKFGFSNVKNEWLDFVDKKFGVDIGKFDGIVKVIREKLTSFNYNN